MRAAALVALLLLSGSVLLAHAEEKAEQQPQQQQEQQQPAAAAAADGKPAAAAAAPAAKPEECKTALDLIAAQNMNLPLHPVFQNILASKDLQGTLFIPTTKAWDSFFATMRQRQGNPAAPAMVARYGQILLYHLAKDVAVPIAEPTPKHNKFAVPTASTLQCTFGPGLPNNRLIIKKTPKAILVQHGTGNATIMSQRIPYCGGEAYLVDEVLNPCSDIAAIMGEIANVPSPCKNNVEATLNRNGLSYFNALLLATGVQRPIFSSVRPFTLFAPSDKAVQEAFRSGALNYPYMFARNKTQLDGVVAFHAVPQYQFNGPSKQTLNMRTLLSEGMGEAKCANPSLSWRSDGHVYGGTGSAVVGSRTDRGCNTQVHVIDTMLQPCCKAMEKLLGGADGLAAKAPAGSIQEKAYKFLAARVKGGAKSGTTFVMPTADAWAQFEEDAKKQKVHLTDAKLEALFRYLLTQSKPKVGTPTPMELAQSRKSLKALCPATKQKATLVFAVDNTAAPKGTAAAGGAGAADGAGMSAGAAASDDSSSAADAPATADASSFAPLGEDAGAPLGEAPATTTMAPTTGGLRRHNAGRPGRLGGGSADMSAEAPPADAVSARPVAAAPAAPGATVVPGLGPLRRLLQAVAGAAAAKPAADEKPAAADAKADANATDAKAPAAGAKPAAKPAAGAKAAANTTDAPAADDGPDGPVDEDPNSAASAASSGLLLPTSFVSKPGQDAPVAAGTSLTAATGPIIITDGQEMELKAGVAIPVVSMTYACDGIIYNVDAVPLPCNLLNRSPVKLAAQQPLKGNVTGDVLPAVASANASAVSSELTSLLNASRAADAPAAGAKSGAGALPVASTLLAAALLGAMLL